MTRMTRPRQSQDVIFYGLVAVTAATFVFEILFVFLGAPIEARMGIVQKIFYFHVPSAYAMYLGATACFVGSVGYLARPSDASDALRSRRRRGRRRLRGDRPDDRAALGARRPGATTGRGIRA